MKLYNYLPSIDLHGCDTAYAKILIEEFIEDQKIMKNKECLIIHGIGTGTLRKVTAQTLKSHHLVEEYKVDNFNPGCTIVKLK